MQLSLFGGFTHPYKSRPHLSHTGFSASDSGFFICFCICGKSCSSTSQSALDASASSSGLKTIYDLRGISCRQFLVPNIWSYYHMKNKGVTVKYVGGLYLIERGGASRMIVSWVGFAKMPLSFNLMQMSYAEPGDSASLFKSTAFSKPLPRTSLMIWGNFCWIFCNWSLNSCPNFAALQWDRTQKKISPTGYLL